MQASIQADNLCVERGHVRILDDLSFNVKPRSITGLLGPSGSGKTTLMRAIVGTQKTHSGQLTVLGYLAGAKELRPKVSYVAQSSAIYTDLTVVQNLAYFATLANASRQDIDKVLEAVHLDGKKDKIVSRLSGGEQTRVSIAIALLDNPEVLVLDEPTVGLDPLLRKELWQLFAGLAAEGRTLLVSSHVMDEAERCEQLLLLRAGKLLWSDTTKALLQKTSTQNVEDAFLAMVTPKEVG